MIIVDVLVTSDVAVPSVSASVISIAVVFVGVSVLSLLSLSRVVFGDLSVVATLVAFSGVAVIIGLS